MIRSKATVAAAATAAAIVGILTVAMAASEGESTLQPTVSADSLSAPAVPSSVPPRPSSNLSSSDLAALAEVQAATFTHSGGAIELHSRNERLSRLLGAQAERDFRRITRAIMGRAAYPHKIKIDATPCNEKGSGVPSGHRGGSGQYRLSVGADGVSRRTIRLIPYDSRGRFDKAVIDRVLPHELCHVVLTDWFGDRQCPLFLQEGLAMLTEHGPHDSYVLLAGAAAVDGAIDLATLTAATAYPAGREDLFYAQSYSLVAYLYRTLGDGRFRDFLGFMKSGSTLVDAVNRAADDDHKPCTQNDVESSWRRDAITQAMVLRALTDSVKELNPPPLSRPHR